MAEWPLDTGHLLRGEFIIPKVDDGGRNGETIGALFQADLTHLGRSGLDHFLKRQRQQALAIEPFYSHPGPRQPDLRFIEGHNRRVHIGALTTYAQMIASSLLQTEAPALVQASSVVGSVQTQHRGTLGGNIGNASPAGDTLPPLLVLNAEVTLVSTDGERSLALAELLQGPGQTAIGGHEVIHHVSIERPPPNASSIFMRLGNRRGMAVSVASAALVLRMGEEKVVDEARIALGAVAPTVIRCPRAETLLRREPLSQTLVEEAAQIATAECSPIDDVRGTAGYRRNAVAQLVGRGLQALAARM